MFTWKEYQVEQQRRHEERIQANRHRVVKAALSTREHAVFNVQRALGKRLVDWGTRLQKRCKEMAAVYPELTQELLEGHPSQL